MTMEQVRNQGLASDVGRANLLTNGGLRVWQRGGSFNITGPATGYTADRWLCSPNGTSVAVVTNPAAGSIDGGRFLALTGTYNAGVIGISQTLRFTDGDFGYNLRSARVTFSAWVSANNSNVTIGIQTDGTGGTFTYVAHPGDGVWRKLSITISVPYDASWITVYGLYLIGSATGYLSRACLVLGDVAADYVPMHPADDLARCMRYYEMTTCAQFALTGMVAGGGVYFPFMYKAHKPIAPTVTLGPLANWQVLNPGGGGAAPTSIGMYGGQSPTYDGWAIQMVGTPGMTAGQAAITPVSAGGATIAVEANP